MQQFRDSVAEWSAWANLNFVESIAGHPNFITVLEDPALAGGFSSSIGMGGGEQFVRIGPNAWNRGTICHEVGHAIGLWHEQQRPDRDTYVIINFSNIAPGDQGNFAIIPDATTHGAYDFYSVMHYARTTLAINPNMDTISMQPAYASFADVIGNNYDRTLSKLDRAGMAEVYGNPTSLPSATVTNTKDSGSGSLRTAIYYAFDRSTDAVPVPTAVTFNIPTSDPGFAGGVFTIKPTYLLVAPGTGTTIDGATQTMFTGDTNTSGPEIVLDGSTFAAQNLGFGAAGLQVHDANCTIKNLVINGFPFQGIVMFGSGTMGNLVSGCYLGTDKTGSIGVPNGFPGVELYAGPHNNTIGGTTAAARNVISGNAHHGVVIQGAGSNNNLVAGNFIGTNAVGTGALSNLYTGVAIFGGAQNNIIGGTASGARNVLSGNKRQGFIFADAGTTGNVAQGNYVGLNAAGTAAIANGNENFATHSFYPGAAIFNGAQNNVIGGTAAGAANVISGNTGQGIIIADAATNGNAVRGNFIGTNPAGTSAMGNGFADPPNNYRFAGISIFGGAQSNTIGGTTAAAANVLSGNAGQGITISNSGTNANVVQGNFIGTNAAGTNAVANGFAGISIFTAAQGNIIGGPVAGARNVISGNSNQGITLSENGTNGNVIQGNFIGTNAAGTAALANVFEGIALFSGAQSNSIGGNTPGTGNVISGNLARGVGFFDAATSNNVVQGNLIGLNAAGTAAIANSFSGVEIFLSVNNTIGGASGGARNYISGNSQRGVLIDGTSATGNKVIGNTIGLTRSGVAAPNGSAGVSMFAGAHGNTVGGSLLGESNVITANSAEGLALFDATTIANTISRNSIYANAFTGIGLFTNSNNNQPAPILSSATLCPVGNPNGMDVNGSIVGAATVEFFANPSGDDEGRFFVGTLNAPGGSFSASLGATVPAGYIITATATASGSSSQFSNTVGLVATDSDGDGIPDNWMNAHFGHPTGQAGDNSLATDDADGDGLTNFQEFRAGTDPVVAGSRLRITAVTRSGSDLVIAFASVVGKTYRIETKDDLSLANWTLLQDQVFATSTSTQITDLGATTLSKRFYRVLIEP